MSDSHPAAGPVCRGVLIRCDLHTDPADLQRNLLTRLDAQSLSPHLIAQAGTDTSGSFVRLRLNDSTARSWAPGFGTMALANVLGLRPQERTEDLCREIVTALLLSPVELEFPSLDEFESAVCIRRNIVLAARKTSLSFETDKAERPAQYWTYAKDRGFTIRPGVTLIDALIMATQPDVSGQQYSFSCYRATEYILLLGIAQELERCNPPLLARLQTLWTQRALMSAKFHEVFLRELGSIESPLPPLYYVPGDRVWFRNPDEPSADATGFEGSWVVYLGSGLFNNFWNHDKPYSLRTKCVEIYHWRHGLYLDTNGEARIDEIRIAPMIAATLNNPAELERVMALMTRWREPRGVYTDAGGCMDTSREFSRWVRPDTGDMPIPKT